MDTTLIVTIRALLSTDRRKSGQPESLVFQRSFEHRVSSEQFVTLIMNRTIVLLGQCVLHFETSGETLLGIAEQEGEVVFNMKGVILNEHQPYLNKMIGWGWQPVLTKRENTHVHLPIDEEFLPEHRPTIITNFAKNPPVPLQHLQGIRARGVDRPLPTPSH